MCISLVQILRSPMRCNLQATTLKEISREQASLLLSFYARFQLQILYTHALMVHTCTNCNAMSYKYLILLVM